MNLVNGMVNFLFSSQKDSFIAWKLRLHLVRVFFLKKRLPLVHIITTCASNLHGWVSKTLENNID